MSLEPLQKSAVAERSPLLIHELGDESEVGSRASPKDRSRLQMTSTEWEFPS